MKRVEIVKVRTEDLKPGMVVRVSIRPDGVAASDYRWLLVGDTVVKGAQSDNFEDFTEPNQGRWPFENGKHRKDTRLRQSEVAFYVEVNDGDDDWVWYVQIAPQYDLWEVQVVTETLEGEPDIGPVTSTLTAREIESALRTLAELYENADETGEYLSTYQQELAARVLQACTEE